MNFASSWKISYRDITEPPWDFPKVVCLARKNLALDPSFIFSNLDSFILFYFDAMCQIIFSRQILVRVVSATNRSEVVLKVACCRSNAALEEYLYWKFSLLPWIHLNNLPFPRFSGWHHAQFFPLRGKSLRSDLSCNKRGHGWSFEHQERFMLWDII